MTVGLKQFGSEVTDFLAELKVGPETRVLRLLRLLKAQGGQMRTDSKPLGNGLFELTPSYDGMEYRLIYVFHRGDAVILNCFIKKKRKTPTHELQLAKDRLKLLVSAQGNFDVLAVH
jgi:phage-related protein